jgi:hypothetical protein
MDMKTSISGRNIAKSMRQLARDAFAEYPNVGCVCVGVKNIGGRQASGRATDGGERQAFVALSGDAGRRVLRENLIETGGVGRDATSADVTGMLETMASTLAIYGSAKRGTAAIAQKETWLTHNCAESNLALFLYRQGVDFAGVVIASYETVGGSLSFKPLCHNCAQWVRQHFKVLVEFDSSVRT